MKTKQTMETIMFIGSILLHYSEGLQRVQRLKVTFHSSTIDFTTKINGMKLKIY